MGNAVRALLLGGCLLPAIGAGHCAEGDARYFATSGVICGSGSRCDQSPIVLMTIYSSGLDLSRTDTIAIYNGGGEVTREQDGTIERRSLSLFPPEEARAFHDRLVAAGAGDLRGAEPPGCIVTYNSDFRATFFEPSPLTSLAWSNSFSFSSCGASAEARAVWSEIRSFVNAHVDPAPF